MGKVEKIYTAPGHGAAVVSLDQARLEKDRGIVGDRYHADAERLFAAGEEVPSNQVTLIEIETLDDFIARHDASLDHGDFRRSLITRGIDLNALVGRSFLVGEALCEGVELCEPCAWLAKKVRRAVLPELVHRAGIRAIVKQSGTVAPGAPVKILE